jgi:hypothetical protein
MNKRWTLAALGGLVVAKLVACSVALRYDDVPPSSTITSTAQGGGGTGGQGGMGLAAGAGGTGAGGMGGSGGGPLCSDFGSDCYGCAMGQCPDLYCGCVTDAECAALSLCVASCAPANSLSCVQPCYAQYPDLVSESALLDNCIGSACLESCPGYEPLTACRLCLFTDCPAAMNACLADADCAPILLCSEACPADDPACVPNCNGAHPAGQPLAADVAACLDVHCQAECPWSG